MYCVYFLDFMGDCILLHQYVLAIVLLQSKAAALQYLSSTSDGSLALFEQVHLGSSPLFFSF